MCICMFSMLVEVLFFILFLSALGFYRPQNHSTSYCCVNWIVVYGNVFGLLFYSNIEKDVCVRACVRGQVACAYLHNDVYNER